MNGLADRITPTTTSGPGGRLIELFPRAAVLVIEGDPSTTTLIRPLAAHCDIAVAGGAREALALLHRVRPAVILIDLGINPDEADALADGLAVAGLDAIPLITVDPSEPINADALMERVRAAFHVTRRVWFGGGLRSRLAA
jgi:chemotaxis response regulator CheB